MTKERNIRLDRLALVLLGAGLVAVFLPCWRAATFLGREDGILHLPLLSTWRNAPIVFSQDFMIFTDGLYRPLSYAAVAILRTVVSEHAICFWHATLIALHGLNALLVFLMVRRLVKNRWAAFLSAGIFAFHPLASVLANEMDHIHILLGCTFYLASLCAYLTWRDQGRVCTISLAVLVYAAGLLTSPVVATVLVPLLAIEFLYERGALRDAAPRLLPFLLVTVAALPLWVWLRPHPLLYTYAAAKGGEIPSFLSMVAGSRWYVLGLLTGHGIPVVLHDAMRRVYHPLDGQFLFWLLCHTLVIAVGIWRTCKRDPMGLGILIAYGAMVPFLSTAWNPVDRYVSWAYMYVPLVGLALMLGQLTAKGLSARRAPVRLAVAVIVVGLLGAYATRLCRINYAARDRVAYWTYVTQLDSTNQAGQVELGKAYLAKNAPHDALKHLFTQGVRDLNEPRRALCRYYSRTGQLRPALVHASYMTGALDMAHLFEALQIPDHAESAYGDALARNPFDTEAMKQLAMILAAKGYLKAARRWLRLALDINPSDETLREARDRLEDIKPSVADPPRADWLRFLLNRRSSGQVRAELVALSNERPDDPIIQMVAAQSLIEGGDAAGGVAKLEAVADRMRSSPFFAEFYSYALTASGDPLRGAAVATAALREDPKNDRLLYHLGTALLVQKKPVEAIVQYQKAIQLNGDFAAAYSKLAYAYTELGQMEKAIACYRRALEINPDLAEARTNLGAALLRKGWVEEAISHYRTNVEMNPTDPTAHFSLGCALAEAGKLDEAIACYSEALRLKPDYVHAHNNLGGVWLAKKNAAKAIEHYRAALRIQPSDEWAHFNLGRALAIQGKDNEAIAEYNKAIQLDPRDPQAHYDLAALLARQGDFARAIQHLTEAHRLRPNAIDPADRLAWLLATCPDPALRDGPRAVALAERACQLTRQRDPRLLDALAAAYAEAGRFDDAVQTGKRALRLIEGHSNRLSTLERNELARDLRDRLERYKAGRPYHGTHR
ncbi:MAG: tetratricopeptide repeat protein [Planctomycetes bacterium]|nr:tetratricopeptide repeat protein [Planctomycetota bacterium]